MLSKLEVQIKPPGSYYMPKELVEILTKLKAQGFDAYDGSPAASALNQLTIHQLDVLVNAGPE